MIRGGGARGQAVERPGNGGLGERLPKERRELDGKAGRARRSHNIKACPDGEIGRRSGLKIRRL